MNSRPYHRSDLSQSDADFLIHLTDFVETIEPDPTFKLNLEAELRQTHSSKSSQTLHKGTHLMNFVFPRLNRRTSLVACTSLAIAATLLLPTLTSERATQKASAQTIAQAMATGAVTIKADNTEVDETIQTLKATGNAVFDYPDAQIQAKADEIRYAATSKQITLLGNVQITQRGEYLQGTEATCSFEEKQCKLTQK